MSELNTQLEKQNTQTYTHFIKIVKIITFLVSGVLVGMALFLT